MAHLQVLESDPDSQNQLRYRAKESEWTQLLSSTGLLNQNNIGDKLSGGTGLKTTMGGPNQAEADVSARKKGEYAVVAIMGPQSSGKSTILNLLFGTRFEVMDHTQGRHQVTTGIWMGACPKAPDLMILDLEGTDALERKGNRGNFERQTSLMALALSEVLIVNMWASDIGRASGMNVDTLKAVIEANLRLFSPNSKTLLFFLIREQSPDEKQRGVTPAAKLQEIILRTVNDIWRTIDKPDRFLNAQLTDMFDINFYFLPPLIYYNQLFNERVQNLYERFTNPNHGQFIFNTDYHHSKTVPPEGLFTWTKQIWDAISKDEALNIPDQQKLLSAYRCEHALTESYQQFTVDTKEIEQRVENEYVDKFGLRLDAAIEKAVAMYRETANKYDKEEAQEKYLQLVEKIETQVQYLMGFQLKHLSNEAVQLYESEMRKSLPRSQCSDNFTQVLGRVSENVRKYWSQKLNASLIKTDNTHLLNKDFYWKAVSARLAEATKALRLEQWGFLLKEFQIHAEQQLTTKVAQLFRNASSTVWQTLSNLRIEFHGKVLHSVILRKLDGLMFDKPIAREKREELMKYIDDLILARCAKFSNKFEKILEKAFDEKFLKTSNGVPREWKTGVDIRSIFTAAKESAEELLNIGQHFVLEGNSELNLAQLEETFLTADRIEEIQEDFTRYTDNQFRLCEGRIRNSEFGGSLLPSNPVSWLIFLFFAWNEIWALMKNPLLLILLLLLGGVAFLGYQVHMMGFDVKTAAWHTLGGMVQFVVNQLQQFQQAHMQAVEDTRARYSPQRAHDSGDTFMSGNEGLQQPSDKGHRRMQSGPYVELSQMQQTKQ